MMNLHQMNVDILVLGSGLAGLRAALSAHIADPGLRIGIVSESHGPSGSSFANVNNCLGMQVCFSERDREELVQDILNLAAPGHVDRQLAAILARESLDRFQDLVRLGFSFRRNGTSLELHSACFSPLSRRSVVMDDLKGAYALFRDRLSASNIAWLPRMHVLALIQSASKAPAGGALLLDLDRNARVAVRSKSTIMALGGPAPIFSCNLAGPGNPGYSYGIMREAGVDLCNTPFLQMMWCDVRTGKYFPIASLATPDHRVGSHGRPLPAELLALAPQRATHCPCGYTVKDSGFDCFLMANMGEEGWLEMTISGNTFRLAPMAHAGNGGAAIDEHGRTNVPRLYACGECASGMHGANRIGGGMVLATQVFGHRAGVHAARTSSDDFSLNSETFIDLVNHTNKSIPDSSGEKLMGAYPSHLAYSLIHSCISQKKEVYIRRTGEVRSLRQWLIEQTFNVILGPYRSLSK